MKAEARYLYACAVQISGETPVSLGAVVRLMPEAARLIIDMSVAFGYSPEHALDRLRQAYRPENLG